MKSRHFLFKNILSIDFEIIPDRDIYHIGTIFKDKMESWQLSTVESLHRKFIKAFHLS